MFRITRAIPFFMMVTNGAFVWETETAYCLLSTEWGIPFFSKYRLKPISFLLNSLTQELTIATRRVTSRSCANRRNVCYTADFYGIISPR